MNTLHAAITTNNTGVALFHERKSSSSSSIPLVFQRAVDILGLFVEEVWSVEFVSALPFEAQRSAFCFEPQDDVGGKGYMNVVSNDDYYIYSRPLRLPMIERVSSVAELEAVIFTAHAFIIFNMAIAWHQLGERVGCGRYKAKAGQLYDVVLALLRTPIARRSGRRRDEFSFGVLECLVLNNRAHLYYETCDYIYSERCVHAIRKLLWTECLDAHLEENDVDEIRLNLIYLLPPTVAHAA
jgi:hypothetical protein